MNQYLNPSVGQSHDVLDVGALGSDDGADGRLRDVDVCDLQLLWGLGRRRAVQTWAPGTSVHASTTTTTTLVLGNMDASLRGAGYSVRYAKENNVLPTILSTEFVVIIIDFSTEHTLTSINLLLFFIIFLFFEHLEDSRFKVII